MFKIMLLCVAMLVAVATGAQADCQPFNPIDGSCYEVCGNWGDEHGRFQNIPAYSNGEWNGSGCYSGESSYGYKWQCVEYVKRFYGDEVDDPIQTRWGEAKNAYSYKDSDDTDPGPNLVGYPQGGQTRPALGDILCFGPAKGYRNSGHVGIISEVGSNYVKMIDQNRTNVDSNNPIQLSLTSQAPYNVGTIGSSYIVQGWLRDPDYGTYSAAYQGQFPVYPPGYSYFELAPGSILNCYLDMKNTGTAIWTNDGSSPNYVELHSVNSSYTQDEASPLAYNWLGGSNVRMATTSGEVAANGGIGRYSFQIRAPSSPGTYRLRMKLYHPHASEFIPDGDAHVNLEVRVPEPPPPPPPPGIASDVLVYDWSERKVKAALFDGDDWKVDGTWYSGWQPGPSSDYRVFIADDTGDGDADVFLVWVPSGHWEQVYSNGDTFYRHRRLISSWMPNTPNNGRYQYFLGDVSGDGEVDAVVMNVSTGTASVAKGHYVSGGADTFEPQGNWVGGFCDGAIGRFQFMLGDVNGDGKADLVARELSSGRFRWARSTGTSFQAQAGYILSNWTATTDPNRYQVGLTDLDHDNQAELYAYKPASGTIYWANWTGSSFDARSPLITNWGTSSDPFRYKLLTGDLNRDGKSDFTLYKADGGNWYYGLSTGTSITNLATGLTSWGSDASRTRYTPLLGDVGLFHGSGGYSYSLPQTAERSEAALMTVSPNPVCGQSEIQLTLPAGSSADLRLYDASGREVTLVFSGQISTNPFRLAWDPRGSAGEKLKKGVYFLRLTRSSGAVSQKLVVLEP